MATPSLTSSFLCLFTSAAGAGLLSYPHATMNQGVVTNVVVTAGFAVLIFLSSSVLCQTALLFSRCGAMKVRTFEELHLRSLSVLHYRVGVITLLAGIFGSLIGFMIVVGDMVVPLVSAQCVSASFCSFVKSRELLLSAVAMVVALPLSRVQHIHSLWWSSTLAVASVVAVALVITAKAIEAMRGTEGATDYVLFTDRSPVGNATASLVLLMRGNPLDLLLGVPISIFSLSAATQVVPVFLALPPSGRSRYRTPLSLSLLCCSITYILTGVAGYYLYRDSTKGDVLLNLPLPSQGDIAADAAKLLLAIHVLLAYPVLLWPAKECLFSLSASFIKSGGSDAGGGSAGSRTQFLISFILVSTSTACAIFVPQVSVVFGLVGSVIGSWQILIFPGLLLLQWSRSFSKKTIAEDSLLSPAAVEGSEEGGYATEATGNDPYGGNWSDRDTARVWSLASRTVAIDSYSNGGGFEFRVLSTDPLTLRIQGWLLIILGVFVAVIGTAAYVYDTWIHQAP